MKEKTLIWRLICPVLAVLLLGGCTSPSDEQVEITFDGNECTREGPVELQAGEHSFIFNNLTEDNQSLKVDLLLDGHTFQDLVDRINEAGPEWDFNGTNFPDWLGGNARFVAFEKGESAGEEIITFRITRDGDYAISVYNTSTENLYPCGPLKVVEAPPE